MRDRRGSSPSRVRSPASTRRSPSRGRRGDAVSRPHAYTGARRPVHHPAMRAVSPARPGALRLPAIEDPTRPTGGHRHRDQSATSTGVMTGHEAGAERRVAARSYALRSWARRECSRGETSHEPYWKNSQSPVPDGRQRWTVAARHALQVEGPKGELERRRSSGTWPSRRPTARVTVARPTDRGRRTARCTG